jgi:hypothetical protein
LVEELDIQELLWSACPITCLLSADAAIAEIQARLFNLSDLSPEIGLVASKMFLSGQSDFAFLVLPREI